MKQPFFTQRFNHHVSFFLHQKG